VDAAREAIAAGDPTSVVIRAEAIAAMLLQRVINATGVLLHTNLGRAPLAIDRPAGYSNLEFDLRAGIRGSRSGHAASLLARATGAEQSLVVNNGAAAVLLVLATLAKDRPVVVSRGELVEIGGGFRIPEVMAASGAQLVEVGTTNRTRLTDYESALSTDPAVVLKVHPSNYRISGFTETVSVSDIAKLTASRGVPVVVDLGSGLLDAGCPWLEGGPPPWLAGEPAARQTLAEGAALVTFSGDKLLGGPQSGVIAGRADLVAACSRHPLARALRPGGLVLDALQEVALSYLRHDVRQEVPFWRMATLGVDELRSRAYALGVGTVVKCRSVTGGGTIPGVEIPSAGIALDGDHRAELRTADPPIVARVVGGRTICDLRTVDPDDDPALAKAATAATRS
jgi:L-seryl-tRNA(Ser) seleniumtransferase